MEDQKCDKCGCIIYGLGDDYWCPFCRNTFCYDCIKTHGCKVETYSIGSKFNNVRGAENGT